LTHEALAGGVAFEAMKKFEDHQRSKGGRVSHGFAKDLIMGIAGAEMEKLFERRGGLRRADREEAKHRARQQAENLYDQQYGDEHDYNPYVRRVVDLRVDR
jgi:hypothetical protein